MNKDILDDFSPILAQDEFKRVYRPNDDSFFFLKKIREDIESFPSNSIVVEVGCGSGFVIGNISKTLNDYGNLIVAIDISYDACFLTQKFSKFYELGLDVINADGLKGMNWLRGIDVLLFNPPYVPTEAGELNKAKQLVSEKQQKLSSLYKQGVRGDQIVKEMIDVNLIDSSYAGGLNGMEVTWRIINEAIPLINKDGLFYLFLVAENEIQEIVQFMIDHGFSYTQLGRQQKYNEIQFVFRFKKL